MLPKLFVFSKILGFCIFTACFVNRKMPVYCITKKKKKKKKKKKMSLSPVKVLISRFNEFKPSSKNKTVSK